jgi:hypothetical protein
MRLALPLALPLVMGVAYAASPYLALYQMGQAMRHGDARALCADISWDQVRDGLKEDIADGIAGEPQTTTHAAVEASADDLPPFGASFVTNLAGNVVDRTVTPGHLIETMSTLRAAGTSAARPDIEAAHFTSPTSFTVALRPPGEDVVRLRMDLKPTPGGLRWEVTRAWIPQSMLEKSETHAS